MADVYASYTELAAVETEGVAYERRQALLAGSTWASIAIHGGGIEPGSGEVARAVAAGLMNFYEFAGILTSDNTRLHVTSTHFDEPRALGIVADSDRTLSFHGFTGDGTPVTALGGLDTVRGEAIRAALTEAGFTVIDAPQEIGGTSPSNIVNENEIGAGVQLEMSRALRASFFPNGDLRRAMRDSGQRTEAFVRYVAAIRAAMLATVPQPVPPAVGGSTPRRCGSDYGVLITDREGSILAVLNTFTRLEFFRLLNDASTATVEIVPDMDCCELLGNVRSWRNWLHIYRNDAYVWGGPILTADWSLGGVEINAADIVAVLNRRTPHASKSFRGTDLTDIATWLIEDAFFPDDPGHTVEVMEQSGVSGAREYTEDIGQTGDHLRNLADTGLDFTAVGSSILLLPDDWSASVGLLTDADLPDGLSVAEDGTALATRWVVYGEEGSGVKGVAGGVHPYYGLIERSVQDSSIKDSESAQAAARSRLNASLPVPVYIDTQEVTLSPDAGIDVARVVPGWCVDLATTTTCRDVSQRMKVTGLHVTADGTGESVKIQLGPVGDSED